MFNPLVVKHQLRTFFTGYTPLFVALFLAFGLSLMGIQWGRVEDWNADQMAFRELDTKGFPVDGYLKPPLDIYINKLLIVNPLRSVSKTLNWSVKEHYSIELIASRMLTIFLFCATIAMLYGICRKFCGSQSAAVITLIAGTSAGLLEYNHFGTADAPLVFWMTASVSLSLLAGVSGKISHGLLAGVLAGLAGADKYNGIIVAAALPAAVISVQGWRAKSYVQVLAGVLGSFFGFFVGNPGCVFDFHNFYRGFLYNFLTTPVYGGVANHHNFGNFFLSFRELIGWPAIIFLLLALIGTIKAAVDKTLSKLEWTLIVTALAVFVPYYLFFGRFSLLPVRFVLPITPFLLLLAAPGVQRWFARRIDVGVPMSLILVYNILCCVEMGKVFMEDPRMKAQLFAMSNFTKGTLVENHHSPRWDRLGVDVRVMNMPWPGDHGSKFLELLDNDPLIYEGNRTFQSQYDDETFTQQGLKKRNPDYICIDGTSLKGSGDPQANAYFHQLGSELLGYHKIFDAYARPRPKGHWSYPRHIDFVNDRMVIFQKITSEAPP